MKSEANTGCVGVKTMADNMHVSDAARCSFCSVSWAQIRNGGGDVFKIAGERDVICTTGWTGWAPIFSGSVEFNLFWEKERNMWE